MRIKVLRARVQSLEVGPLSPGLGLGLGLTLTLGGGSPEPWLRRSVYWPISSWPGQACAVVPQVPPLPACLQLTHEDADIDDEEEEGQKMAETDEEEDDDDEEQSLAWVSAPLP